MKQKKLKSKRYVSEDTKQLQSLIFITLGVILFVLAIYFLTDIITKKAENKKIDFDYSSCTVGTMFNRPYDEYFVFAYKASDNNANEYKSLISKYDAKEDSIKIYTIDLDANLDNKYLSDKSNTNPQKPSDVKINNSALVHIKGGKVVKYYENLEDYKKVLN